MAFPRWFYFSMIAVFIIPLLVGCSTTKIISSGVSFAVGKYCKIPSGARGSVREVVDSSVYPDKIRITCATDD
jgi:hypothetical protein